MFTENGKKLKENGQHSFFEVYLSYIYQNAKNTGGENSFRVLLFSGLVVASLFSTISPVAIKNQTIPPCHFVPAVDINPLNEF
jgi:hypothetical protein